MFVPFLIMLREGLEAALIVSLIASYLKRTQRGRWIGVMWVGVFLAAALCLGASWAIAFYVEEVAHLGATYGSIATVVVFLIWLSWNVNAIFFGGALATEVELAIDAVRYQPLPLLSDLRGPSRLVWPPKN